MDSESLQMGEDRRETSNMGCLPLPLMMGGLCSRSVLTLPPPHTGHVSSLKQHGLCNHLLFMQWPASTTTQPSKMLRVLREQLAGREFRHGAALTDQGVFEGLIRFGNGVFPEKATPYLVLKSGTSNFDVSQCGGLALGLLPRCVRRGHSPLASSAHGGWRKLRLWGQGLAP